MDTIATKEELKQRIEMEEDPRVLQAVRELLFPEENPIYKKKLISRALKAEEDIKAGRVYTEEEFFRKSQESLKGR